MIQYIDMDKLDAGEQATVRRIALPASEKIARFYSDTIKFHVKLHHDLQGAGTKRKKYSFHARISGKRLEASADGWEIEKVTHQVFDRLLQEIEHLN
jgi:hypothetical protein